MRQAIIDTKDHEFSIDESEFASPEDFDNFVEWAVDMIKTIHDDNLTIGKVLVVEMPEPVEVNILQEYNV